MMTPNEIEVLIHCHICLDPHPRRNAPAVAAAFERFLNQGIIKESGAGTYATTERGFAFVDMLCATPFPVQRWIDPRTDKEVR